MPRFDTRRPFTRGDAIAAGLDPRLLRGSLYRRIFRGVYVDAGVRITPELRAEAAVVAVGHSAFASHASAARIHDVPVPTLPLEYVSVLSRRDRRDRTGIRCHLAEDGDVVIAHGVRVSGHARMFVELATLLPLVDLVVVGDNLVRRGLVTPEALREYCAAGSHPGSAAAADAASYVRRDVDSPMETRLRMLLVLAGMPEPEVNRVIRAADGEPLRRYDLSYEASGLIVEYDGRHHVERDAQWESDIERREAIDDDGWRMIVVTSKGIYQEPERTLLRVWRRLRERGEPGVPARPLDDWRPHFPSRS